MKPGGQFLAFAFEGASHIVQFLFELDDGAFILIEQLRFSLDIELLRGRRAKAEGLAFFLFSFKDSAKAYSRGIL